MVGGMTWFFNARQQTTASMAPAAPMVCPIMDFVAVIGISGAYSPNTFNSLGLGTTQLYNVRTVLNQKRHGPFLLNGQRYFFHRRTNVPGKLTKEVLLVELLNNLKKLAEDPEDLLDNLTSQLSSFDQASLLRAAEHYGTYSTQKKLNEFAGAVSA